MGNVTGTQVESVIASYAKNNSILETAKEAIEELETNSKLQEQYVKHLEQDKENMKKIINILCDTISQLI